MRNAEEIVQELCCAIDRDNAVQLRRLGGEELAVLGEVELVGPARQQNRHTLVALPTMDDLECARGVDAVLVRPLRPDPLDDSIRIDQCAVHVQKEGSQPGPRHVIHPRREAAPAPRPSPNRHARRGIRFSGGGYGGEVTASAPTSSAHAPRPGAIYFLGRAVLRPLFWLMYRP